MPRLKTLGTLYTGRAQDPGCADVAVPRAFRELEDTMPRERIERESGYTVKEIKRCWQF